MKQTTMNAAITAAAHQGRLNIPVAESNPGMTPLDMLTRLACNGGANMAQHRRLYHSKGHT